MVKGKDPIALPDEEYPEWLWELLDEEKMAEVYKNPYSKKSLRKERKITIKNSNFDKDKKK